jgi:hypothetical protein
LLNNVADLNIGLAIELEHDLIQAVFLIILHRLEFKALGLLRGVFSVNSHGAGVRVKQHHEALAVHLSDTHAPDKSQSHRRQQAPYAIAPGQVGVVGPM